MITLPRIIAGRFLFFRPLASLPIAVGLRLGKRQPIAKVLGEPLGDLSTLRNPEAVDEIAYAV
ncbi:MAG: hypothetical protein QXM22_04720 [Candidatus Bathyarchaeia archaeon]